jgi:hypothetical protein
LDALEADPFSGDIKRLQPPAWRRRVGEYRVFYDFLLDDRLVAVTAIERRSSTTYSSAVQGFSIALTRPAKSAVFRVTSVKRVRLRGCRDECVDGPDWPSRGFATCHHAAPPVGNPGVNGQHPPFETRHGNSSRSHSSRRRRRFPGAGRSSACRTSASVTMLRNTRSFLRERGVPVQVTVHFDNLQMMKEAVAHGAGVSIMPARVMREEIAQGRLLPVRLIPSTLFRPVRIVHRKRKRFNCATRAFLELLQAPVPTEAEAFVGVAGNGRSS